MTIDLAKLHEIPLEGLGFSGPDGETKVALLTGDTDPLGEAAPLGSFYLHYGDGSFWQKVGPGVNDWEKNGPSFSEAFEFQGFAELTQSSTTSNGWVDKLLETTQAKSGGDYYFGWSLEAGQSDKQKAIGTRVQLDLKDGNGYQDVQDIRNGVATAGEFTPRSGFAILDSLPAEPLGYDIRVQFGQTTNGGIGFIQAVSVLIYKIGGTAP